MVKLFPNISIGTNSIFQNKHYGQSRTDFGREYWPLRKRVIVTFYPNKAILGNKQKKKLWVPQNSYSVGILYIYTTLY